MIEFVIFRKQFVLKSTSLEALMRPMNGCTIFESFNFCMVSIGLFYKKHMCVDVGF